MQLRLLPVKLLIIGILLAAMPTVCHTAWQIERVRDGKQVSFQEMLAEIRSKKFIFIGEVHDQPDHHRLQLEILRALKKEGAPLAIGLEMFGTDYQRELDHWIAGKTGLMEFVKVYQQNWNIPWPLYDSIFLYARNNKIPLVALNPPRELVQKVFYQGFASLTPQEKRYLPTGVTCNVDTSYRRFIKEIYKEHGTDDKSFEHFCEAQMLRNQTIARLIREFMLKHPRSKMVVLTGIGHAMRRGAPSGLEEDNAGGTVIVIPATSEQTRDALRKDDADYYVTGFESD